MPAARSEPEGAPGSPSPDDNFGFPPFTDEEKQFLRAIQAEDTLELIQRDWGLSVLRRPPAERPTLVAAKLEVLEGLGYDPAEWVRRALELAADGGGPRADR